MMMPYSVSVGNKQCMKKVYKMNYNSRLIVLLLIFAICVLTIARATEVDSESDTDVDDEPLACDHTFKAPEGFFRKHINVPFWKKFFKHLNPFADAKEVNMKFYLYKRNSSDCGKEIVPHDDESLQDSGFSAQHPTRVIIHGWLSQGRGKLNRRVKDAYLTLAERNLNSSTSNAATDFNVIVVDWSIISSNVNYYKVVKLISPLGYKLTELLLYLHEQAGLNMNDVYLIGHSLGAQIAGSVGKQIQPLRINTIFALDPAGPSFHDVSENERITDTDAEYVESIQTSKNFGFQAPVGHATFYPNFGYDQKKCYKLGCSHSRSHHYFAESIISTVGFWGAPCERQHDGTFIILDKNTEYRMGGEPSIPKKGTFYVKTFDTSPYAMGKKPIEM